MFYILCPLCLPQNGAEKVSLVQAFHTAKLKISVFFNTANNLFKKTNETNVNIFEKVW